MYLHAPTAIRLSSEDLTAQVRARFGNELRRAGTFAQIGMLGAQTCIDAAPGSGPLGVLCVSELGALSATCAVLSDAGLARGEPAMPFTFIATQPHLAGVLLAQRGMPVTRVLHLHLAPDAWPWALYVARQWLNDCARVLTGWVEEDDGSRGLRSDWCIVQNAAADGTIACEEIIDAAAVSPAAQDWLQRVASWQGVDSAPLLLQGAERRGWCFRAN